MALKVKIKEDAFLEIKGIDDQSLYVDEKEVAGLIKKLKAQARRLHQLKNKSKTRR